eukprot:CAMPEP_0114529732 /NCGR_PEP_ID=MMETSP0109-20121206/25023_1 /TAXON_ID=29199 /ORGANISM="Chlorarachnion reptans, Strain CCCM449" /LENGTH=816 /DNA_ID=CAMNT_0001712217 /DNA_START=120 /DNA_END=2570 /DNA_ORIENTATION=-
MIKGKLNHLLSLVLLFSPRVHGECDLKIGGLFQMCRFPTGIQRELAARAAFCERFNCSMEDFKNFADPQSHYILNGQESGLNISYILFSSSDEDEFTDLSSAVSKVVDMISKLEVVAFLGPNDSRDSQAVGPVTKAYKTPHISFASTSDELSDKKNFPYLYQTVPLDIIQATAMIEFVVRMNWKSFSMIFNQDSYGANGAKNLKLQADSRGLELRSQIGISDKDAMDHNLIRTTLDFVIRSGSKIIILFTQEQLGESILRQAQEMNMHKEGYVFLLADGTAFTDIIAKNLTQIARGLIGFEPRSRFDSMSWRTFNTTWVKKYNRQGLVITDFRNESCTQSINGRQNSYKDYGSYMDTLAPYAFDTMKILLEAIVGLANQNITPCRNKNYRQILANTLNKTAIQGVTGRVEFDNTTLSRKGGGDYDVWNHNGKSWIRIMSYSSKGSPNLVFNDPFSGKTAPIWPNGDSGLSTAPASENPVRFERHTFAWYRNLFPSVAAVVGLFILVVSLMTFKHRENRILRVGSPNLLQVMNFGHILLLIAIFCGFPRPSTASCVCEVVFGHFGFVLSIGALLAKNYRIAKIFFSDDLTPCVLTDLQLIGYISAAVAILVAYLITWMIVVPSMPTRQSDPENERFYYETCSHNLEWNISIVGVEFVILGCGAFLAWKIRNAPWHFNESHAIGASLYAICIVAAAALCTILLGDPNDPGLEYAAVSLGILVSVVVMQVTVNIPKFIILHKYKDMPFESTESKDGEKKQSSRGDKGSNKCLRPTWKLHKIGTLIRKHSIEELAEMVIDAGKSSKMNIQNRNSNRGLKM